MAASLALVLAVSIPAVEQTVHLSCTMAGAKDRPFMLAVGQSKVALEDETFKAVFTPAAVQWTKPRMRGDGYFLFTLDRSYRRITIAPMADGRTPLAQSKSGICRKLPR